MRDYGTVASKFWTGETGKALKAAGSEAVIVALYLMTSPHANMIGVYHLPIGYMAIDTGLGFEGASKGLTSAIEAGFCTFDPATDYVFVHEFAMYQVGACLSPRDKRCSGVHAEVKKIPKGLCYQGFVERYNASFHLDLMPDSAPEEEAPSKPLRSQKQEQVQEQNQKQEQEQAAGARLTAVDLSIAMRGAGVGAQPADPRLIALAAQGVTAETAVAACEEAKRAKPKQRVAPAYVFAIIERWAADAAAMVAGGAAPPHTRASPGTSTLGKAGLATARAAQEWLEEQDHG